MISQNILQFLKDLRVNNNREWFVKNKKSYDLARREFELLTGVLITEIGKFDKDIQTLLPKDCIFRIFRDIRFSNDKTPYKTNFGAYMSKGGRKGSYAGYYLHIEPTGSFLAGGIYMPPSPVLRAIRNDIYNNIDEFNEILSDEKFRKYFGEIWGDKLTGPPHGFSKDFQYIELLKYKDYNVGHQLNQKQLTENDFVTYAAEVYKAMVPFNRFLNNAIAGVV